MVDAGVVGVGRVDDDVAACLVLRIIAGDVMGGGIISFDVFLR